MAGARRDSTGGGDRRERGCGRQRRRRRAGRRDNTALAWLRLGWRGGAELSAAAGDDGGRQRNAARA
jgi:hypothetical protein